MSDYYSPAGSISQTPSNQSGNDDTTPKNQPETPQPKTEQTVAPPPPSQVEDKPEEPKIEPEETTKETPQAEPPVPPKDDAKTPLEAAKDAPDAESSYNAFVDALILDLGFDKAGEKEKEKLVEAIKRRVEARVLRVLMASLTTEQNKELDKEVAEKGLQEDAIIKLLSEKAPDASNAILSALEDLYTEMKEETNMLWEAASAKTASEKAEEAPENK